MAPFGLSCELLEIKLCPDHSADSYDWNVLIVVKWKVEPSLKLKLFLETLPAIDWMTTAPAGLMDGYYISFAVEVW